MKELDFRKDLIIISLIGLLFVFSSSAVFSYYNFANKCTMFFKQSAFVIIGFAIFLMLRSLNPQKLLRILYYLFTAFTLITLIMVLIRGVEINNAKRWLRVFGIMIQPSEFFKISAIILFIFSLNEKGTIMFYEDGKINITVLVNISIIIFSLLLIMLQPDFGTALLIIMTLICGFVVSRIKIKYIIITAIMVSLILFIALITSPYRLSRVRSFFDPSSDTGSLNYQIVQSKKAIRDGGLLGKGPGNSNQKIFYLPQAWSDFIFSIIAEETGFIGVIALLILYFFFYKKIYMLSFLVSDPKLKYFVFLIFILLILQTAINIGVTIGILPTTGMPLPFISAGGSSYIALMTGLGICEGARIRV